jgi:hypothetical protein
VEGSCHFWVFPAVMVAPSGVPPRRRELIGTVLEAATIPPTTEPGHAHTRLREQSPSHFSEPTSPVNNSGIHSLPSSKSAQARPQAIAREVRMYCFRFGICGTFMPLSGVRGVSRIAVVWTQLVAAISAISSLHFNVLFTRAVVRLAVAFE